MQTGGSYTIIMAEQTVPITGDKEPTIIKKSDVMTKRDSAHEKAAENKIIRQLPPKPGRDVSFKEMMEWLKLLTPEMCEGSRVLVYIYRLEPVIVRQKSDPNNDKSIDVIVIDPSNMVFGEQYMIDYHGGGKYSIYVNDVDAPKKDWTYIHCIHNIPLVEHAPKLNLLEVDWYDRKNKGFEAYARAKGWIDEKNMPIVKEGRVDGAMNSAATSTAVEMTKTVLDFVKTMNSTQEQEFKKRIGGEDAVHKGVMEILIEKMKQDDPNKALTGIVSVITAVKAMTPETKPDMAITTILPLMLKMMETAQERSDKMMMQFMEIQKGSNGESSGSKISELKDLLEVARELRGGSPGHKSTAAEIIDSVSPILGPALNLVTQIIGLKMGGAPNMPIQQGPATAQANGETNVEPQPPQLTQGEAAKIIQAYGPMILNNLAEPGYEFGAMAAKMLPGGDAQIAAIGRHGVDGLLAGAKAVPEFYNQIMTTYGEEYLRKWLGEFINYKAEIDKIEREEDEEESK